ncbi:hypothetical protein NEMVEDRAFT_v1g223930 [Sporocytophaga myxococcoides]|uniref:Uncharacterized protein n=2 Tax=Sporocytophaga myxococcoides TaxID=153721 RepID=A0A098LH85_9BACT|nr:hypothetical protein NEMVEDRAFT_v1g223930 [Sporocytophaga myxococcoides]
MEREGEFHDSYDFGARNYDPRIGRFITIDPYSQVFPNISPYSYAQNSPIYFVDEDGKYPKPSELLAKAGIELSPLAAGLIDGAFEGSPFGMVGLAADLTDAKFRADMIDAFSAIATDPIGVIGGMFIEYKDVIERVLSGKATDEDQYLIGNEIGAAVIGSLSGGALSKYLDKFKDFRKSKAAAGATIDASGNVSGKGLSKLKKEINPFDGDRNCVLCAIAFEKKIAEKINEIAKLSGADSKYINTIKKAFPNYVVSYAYGGFKGLSKKLDEVKSNSAIIVGKLRKAQPDYDAHAFNAIKNKDGSWKFIDTQNGIEFSKEHIDKLYGKFDIISDSK